MAYRGCRRIPDFRDEWLRVFFVEDTRSRRIPSDLESRLFRKLQMLDDATTDQDLRIPPSNHFGKLRGGLHGLCPIRVNKQWRVIFRWDGSRTRPNQTVIDPRARCLISWDRGRISFSTHAA
ncbi:MAG: type II toxin-antitoxin system RelE/ParE family toxin [Acidiferrobacteraceae bacterium]